MKMVNVTFMRLLDLLDMTSFVSNAMHCSGVQRMRSPSEARDLLRALPTGDRMFPKPDHAAAVEYVDFLNGRGLLVYVAEASTPTPFKDRNVIYVALVVKP